MNLESVEGYMGRLGESKEKGKMQYIIISKMKKTNKIRKSNLKAFLQNNLILLHLYSSNNPNSLALNSNEIHNELGNS